MELEGTILLEVPPRALPSLLHQEHPQTSREETANHSSKQIHRDLEKAKKEETREKIEEEAMTKEQADLDRKAERCLECVDQADLVCEMVEVLRACLQ